MQPLLRNQERNAMTTLDSIERMYSLREVSQITGVKLPTLQRWVRTGVLTAARPGGGHALVTATAVRKLLGQQPECAQANP